MTKLVREIGKKGYLTYKYEDRYLYSLYDPQKEADKYLKTFGSLKKYVITLCGTDYINNSLLKEDVFLILSYNFKYFELFIESPKVLRFDDFAHLEKILLLQNVHSNEITIITWQPLIAIDPPFYLSLLSKLKDLLNKISFSANTANTYGFLENWNAINNLSGLSKINIVHRALKKAKNPAFIFASGASLEDNVTKMHKYLNKVFTFALPSAVPYLLANKITPDFVIAVDPGYATFYHLYKIDKPLYLLTPLTVTQSIFKISYLKFLFFSYGSLVENIIYKGLSIIETPPEGSVIFNLLRILPQLGFEECLIFGLDFGFKENRSHVKEGNFEQEALSLAHYLNPIETEIKKRDYRQKCHLEVMGKKILSTIPFKIYYDHFIQSEFNIKIFLLQNSYNPLGTEYQKVEMDYFDDYANKPQIQEIITSQEININDKERQMQITKIKRELIAAWQNNKKENEFYYHSAHTWQKNKIEKLLT